jgi:hypothetical protein
LHPEQQIPTNESFRVTATIRNTGSARFRTEAWAVGSVHLGVHLYDATGKQVQTDYARFPLRAGEVTPVEPGESVALSVTMPAPAPGKYTLGFDLVSEAVCWFAPDRSAEVKFPIEVRPR